MGGSLSAGVPHGPRCSGNVRIDFPQNPENVAAYEEMKGDFEQLDRPALVAQCVNALQATIEHALANGHGAVVVGAIKQLTVLAALEPTKAVGWTPHQ